MALYRDYPHKVLCASDAMAQTGASSTYAIRVHAFLDHWGIINAAADGRVRYAKALQSVSDPEHPKVMSCSVTGEPLERLYYYNTKDPKFVLSPVAFANGLFPPDMCTSDFKRKAANDSVTPYPSPHK